jgi:hypothetical protein
MEADATLELLSVVLLRQPTPVFQARGPPDNGLGDRHLGCLLIVSHP